MSRAAFIENVAKKGNMSKAEAKPSARSTWSWARSRLG